MYRRFLSATLRVTLATVLLMAVALGSLAAYFIRQNFQGQADELAARTVVAEHPERRAGWESPPSGSIPSPRMTNLRSRSATAAR